MPDISPMPPSPVGPTPDAPQGAPMSVPTEKEGEKTRARMEVQNAVKVLERALSIFGVNSQEGKTLLSSIKALAKIGGEPGGGDMSKAGVDLLQSIIGAPPPRPGAPESGGDKIPPAGPGGGAGLPFGLGRGPMPTVGF